MSDSAYFSVGPRTYKVPMSMHAQSRQKLVTRLQQANVSPNATVLLKGGAQQTKYDTDKLLLFEQESFFQYLFGVKEPGFYGAIDVATGRSMLFMPRLGKEWAVWMGHIHTPEDFQSLYEVDEVHYVDEMAQVLRTKAPDSLLVLEGKNSDSGAMAEPADFVGSDAFTVDSDTLFPILVECRVHKSPAELELLQYVNDVSSAAHRAVMQLTRPGMVEFQMEAAFLYHAYVHGGARFTSYTCICGGGAHAATLHYGHQGAPNDTELQDGDLFLHDSGAQYHGYTSDITCTFPINGRFTPEQKAIYEVVLAANRAVQQTMEPGIAWPAMHRLAEQVIAKGLTDIGILKGNLEELMDNHIPALFMPHGLGHFMGLDSHDVGGYPEGVKRINEPGIRHLRTARDLEKGMVITVEPGIYFIDALLEPALADRTLSRFLNKKMLTQFRSVGGVRIEDDVALTADGTVNMTKVPREVQEIETLMQQGREVKDGAQNSGRTRRATQKSRPAS